MNIVWWVSAAFLVFALTTAPVEAQQCGARVRKDWEALTTIEKDTYKGALAAAMDSGSYIKFVEMHTEMQSEMEAHRQCMFIYWHRFLLVIFENMLRGQGSQYACVTVPYYNWMEANSRVLAGTCSSIGACSSIMSELGGYTSGSQRTMNINGVRNSGRCVTESPLDHFCESGTVSGSTCAHCVPRSNWGSSSVPASTSLASVRQQLFSGQNIGQMSTSIEQGCHNNVHSSLSGTLSTFAAPSDPIFWSHHSMVDALHTIFHKCRVGTQRLTFAQKAVHPVAWTSCSKRNGGIFNPTDVIVMRTGVNGNRPIQGNQDPLIGRYFSGVPNQFAGLMDVRDLGDSSYSYELSGNLADMYNNCDSTSTPTPTSAAPNTPPAPTTAAPLSVTTNAPLPVTNAPLPVTNAPMPVNNAPSPVNNAPLPVNNAPLPVSNAPLPVNSAPLPVNNTPLPVNNAPLPVNNVPLPVNNAPLPVINTPITNAPLATAAPQQQIGRFSWLDRLRNRWGFRRLAVNNGCSGPSSPNQGKHVRESNFDGHQAAKITNGSPGNNALAATLTTALKTTSPQYDCNNNNVAVITVDKKSPEAKLVSTWYQKTMAVMGGQCPKAIADMERQVCMFEDQCLGGTPEYSAEFQATWGVKEPRCLTIVKAIKSGQQKITYGKWRQDMEISFGCPKPANSTQSTAVAMVDVYNLTPTVVQS